MRECGQCGAAVAGDARYCPQCGRRLDGERGSTAVIPSPPHETGPVPVSVARAEPHYYGITPPIAVFTLGIACTAAAIVFLALRHVLLGAALLAAAAVLLAVFLRLARRRPDSTVARASTEAVDAVRERTGLAATTAAVRFDARRRARAVRRELRVLGKEHERGVRELGEAVYRGLDERAAFLQRRLRDLDDAAAAKERELDAIAAAARERLTRARREVQPTERLQRPAPPDRP